MNSRLIGTLTAAGVIVLVSACAHPGAPLGDAVRHMTEKQVHNPDARYNPDPEAVAGGDPYRLDDVLEAHRNNAKDLTEDQGALAMGSDQVD